MNNFKRNKTISLLALVLCTALATIFVFAFAGCDDTDAEAVSGDGFFAENELDGEYELFSAYDNGLVVGSYEETKEGWKIFTYFETVDSDFVETVYVENKYVTDTSEFDENGVATCKYGGQTMYLTLGGGIYGFYPYCVTLAPIYTTAETPEIQVSLIFKEEPALKGVYFDKVAYGIEIGSLTGEAVDMSEYESTTALTLGTALDENSKTILSAMEYPEKAWYPTFWDAETSTDTVRIIEFMYQTDSYVLFSIELGNGDFYYYTFSFVMSAVFKYVPDDDIEEEIEEEENIETVDDLFFLA